MNSPERVNSPLKTGWFQKPAFRRAATPSGCPKRFRACPIASGTHPRRHRSRPRDKTQPHQPPHCSAVCPARTLCAAAAPDCRPRTAAHAPGAHSPVRATTPTVWPRSRPCWASKAQHLVKHRGEHRLGPALAAAGQRGMDRRGRGEREAEELPHRDTVGAPPGNAALAVQPLKVSAEAPAEVSARRNPDAPARLGVGSAKGFDERIKLGWGEHGIALGVAGMAGAAGQFCRRDEEFLRPWFASSQCQAH